ncbi:MAG: hypothetical protein KKF93_00700, partial [Candidatus Omnitrophica bacterium]|nr:hypothetical protein [Candidatus Omnitrophota bacterium]
MKSGPRYIIPLLLVLLVNFAAPAFAGDDEYKDLFLAKQVFEDGFYDVALRQLKRFLQQYPYTKRRFDVEFLTGQAYFKLGDLYRASSAFEKLLKESRIGNKERLDEVT